MKSNTEMKLFNAMKGKTIAQVERRMNIMNIHIEQKKLELRVKLAY